MDRAAHLSLYLFYKMYKVMNSLNSLFHSKPRRPYTQVETWSCVHLYTKEYFRCKKVKLKEQSVLW